jgi:hypothetical protein
MDAPNNDYHAIPHIDKQTLTLPEDLEYIGQILAKHGACDHIAAWLAHRHNNLPPGCTMVHRNPDSDTDVCRIERLDQVGDLSPSHFAFRDDRVIACEFKEGLDSRQPSEELLTEVGSYLRARGLDKRLGLSVLQTPVDRWVEYMLADGQGTIARRHSGDYTDGIPTEWAFFPGTNGIGWKVTKECKTPPQGGGHVVVN